jgi:hypothetical protein
LISAAQQRRQMVGPGGDQRSLGRVQGLAGGLAPALGEQLGQGHGHRTVDQGGHLVAGRVVVAGRQAPAGVVVEVSGGVPAVDADVAAADQGHRTVDHHHLLVMAGAGGQGVVQPVLDLGTGEESRSPLRAEQLRGGDRERHVPGQHPHVQRRVQRRLSA